MDKIVNSNAKKALRQLKMEISADYGMSHDDVFDIIENARSQGSLASHFKKLEDRKNSHDSLLSLWNKKM